MTEQLVLIDKLKEEIADRRVVAACFYTFNFDPQFFENYLLTSFLPNVNFSDNEIQNTILWKKYQKDLPAISVYCDFYGKSNTAPSLDYEVRFIYMPSKDEVKACFHPKISFILLDDGSLIFITGSNNLTKNGWCINKEAVFIQRLENAKFFTRLYKDQLKDFAKKVLEEYKGKESEAERRIFQFFNKIKNENLSTYTFFSTFRDDFSSLLNRLLNDNNEEFFEEVEIISPYLSTVEAKIKELLSLTNGDKIRLATPYVSSDEANLTKEQYDKYSSCGVEWSRLELKDKEKMFRFNHSKLYRLKTSKKMFTIIGSVNFTDAAWRGKAANGNIETAVIITEAAANWKSWLVVDSYPKYFTENPNNMDEREIRIDAPDLHFELDWRECTLSYTNYKKNNFEGDICFNTEELPLMIGQSKEIIKLDKEKLKELTENSGIKVKDKKTSLELFYYPIHINIESKPLPSKLKLSDRELLSLWEQISINKEQNTDITERIEKYILARFDGDGEAKKNNIETKSTLNMMATHINGLIKLQDKIFNIPRTKADKSMALEQLNYYLFINNIDTIEGYLSLLDDMYKQERIFANTYWFILSVIKKEFYEYSKINKFIKELEVSKDKLFPEGLKRKINYMIEMIEGKCIELRIPLNVNGDSSKLLKWVNKNI